MMLAADIAAEPPLSAAPATEPAAEIDVPDATQVEDGRVEDGMAEDVNDDGIVSALDALTIINAMNSEAGGAGEDGPANRGGRNDRMDINRDGNVSAIDALRVINRLGRDAAQGRQDRVVEPVSPVDPISPISPIDSADEVQSIDGTGNNLENPEWGSAGTSFARVVNSDYTDGVSEAAGQERLSAREISNLIFDQEGSIESADGLSNLVWQWGQFIDHDITATQGGEDTPLDIEVPAGDVHFDPFGTGTQLISFTRSGVAEGTGETTPAQQVNEITAFIDGSMVYGSDVETSDSLREFTGGLLRTSEGNLLPVNDHGFFEAGDARANEQLGLISMQTLWMREHNRIAEEISASDSNLTDEEIFQDARRQVIAQLQAITFNEYLPQLVGRDAIERYEGYDASVDPSITNLFATAAFRYGHTALPTELARLNDDGTEIEAGNIALQDAFFNPSEIQEHGIDAVLKGLASTSQQEIDAQLVDDVRNFLFGPPGAGGFDLAALNIQRGRDHGLPDYNSAREAMGLETAESFAEISSDVDVQARLAAAYDSVDDVDAWVGMLAEDHVRGGSVGELAATVIAEQFTSLRDGDRFWYQNVMSREEIRTVNETRLSDVIERNTELTSVQENAFVVEGAEADRPETPRPETPRPETPRPETPRPETPRPETPRPETPGPETPGPETPRPESPRPEGPRPEAPEADGNGTQTPRPTPGNGPAQPAEDDRPGTRPVSQRDVRAGNVDRAIAQLF